MLDTQLSSNDLKQGEQIPSILGETIGKLKDIVRLHALCPNTLASIPFEQPFPEVSGGIDGLLWIGSQKTQMGKLINRGALAKDEVASLQNVCEASLSRPPEHVHRNSSSTHKTLADTLFSCWSKKQPNLRMTRNKLSRRQVYSSCHNLCRSSTIPSLGLQQRIFRISFSSVSVC